MTTTILNAEIGEVGNKIPDTSSLVTKIVLNVKINEVKNKIPNNDKHIAIPEFNKLTAENFTAR